MGAPEVLSALSAAGIRLEVRDSKLIAGPRSALTDRHRTLIAAHKVELVRLLSEPRRLWLVRDADGSLASYSFTPPVSASEVRAAYPTARGIEPDLSQPEPPSPGPTPEQEIAVRCWLERIGERDAAIVAETVERIRQDSRAFAYFLARALEPAEPGQLESAA